MSRIPRLLELFCGRGGWSRAAARLGWECIGIDVEDHGYPFTLIQRRLPCSLGELADFHPDLVIASPPCNEFARHHLPWIRNPQVPDCTLLHWSISLVGHFPQVVIECSRFAALHAPGARHCPPYALWGDIPALLPLHLPRKDSHQGTTGCSMKERAARRAEIPPQLAGWIMDTANARLARTLGVGMGRPK